MISAFNHLNSLRPARTGQLWKYDRIPPNANQLTLNPQDERNSLKPASVTRIDPNPLTEKSPEERNHHDQFVILDDDQSAILSMELDLRSGPEGLSREDKKASTQDVSAASPNRDGNLGLLDLSAVVIPSSPATSSGASMDTTSPKSKSTPNPNKSGDIGLIVQPCDSMEVSQPIQILGSSPATNLHKQHSSMKQVVLDKTIAPDHSEFPLPSTASLRELDASTLPFCSYPDPTRLSGEVGEDTTLHEIDAPVSQEDATMELDTSDFNLNQSISSLDKKKDEPGLENDESVIEILEKENQNDLMKNKSSSHHKLSSELDSGIDPPSATLLRARPDEERTDDGKKTHLVSQTQDEELLPQSERVQLHYYSVEASQPEEPDQSTNNNNKQKSTTSSSPKKLVEPQEPAHSPAKLKDGFKTPSIVRTHRFGREPRTNEKTPIAYAQSDTLDSDPISISSSDVPYSARRYPLVSPQPLPDTQPISSLDPNLPHLNDDDEDVFELRQAIIGREEHQPNLFHPTGNETSEPSTPAHVTTRIAAASSPTSPIPQKNAPYIVLSSQPLEREASKLFDESPALMTSENEHDPPSHQESLNDNVKIDVVESIADNKKVLDKRDDQTSRIEEDDMKTLDLDHVQEGVMYIDDQSTQLQPEAMHVVLRDQSQNLPRPASKEVIADSQEASKVKSTSVSAINDPIVAIDGNEDKMDARINVTAQPPATPDIITIDEEPMSPVLESDMIEDTMPLMDIAMEAVASNMASDRHERNSSSPQPPDVSHQSNSSIEKPTSAVESSVPNVTPITESSTKAQISATVPQVSSKSHFLPALSAHKRSNKSSSRKSRGRKSETVRKLTNVPDGEVNHPSSPVKNNNKEEPVSKQCDECQETLTTCWRDGPKGPGTLCDRCGRSYALKKTYAPVLVKQTENHPTNFHTEAILQKTINEHIQAGHEPVQQPENVADSHNSEEPKARSSSAPNSPSPSVSGIRRRKVRMISPTSAYFSSESSSEPDDSSDEDYTDGKRRDKSSRFIVPLSEEPLPLPTSGSDDRLNEAAQEDPDEPEQADSVIAESRKRKKSKKSTGTAGRASKKFRGSHPPSSSISGSPARTAASSHKGKMTTTTTTFPSSHAAGPITPSGNHRPQSKFPTSLLLSGGGIEPSPVKSQNLVPALLQSTHPTTPTIIAKNVSVPEHSQVMEQNNDFQEGEIVWAWWETHFYTALILSYNQKKKTYRIGYLSDGQEEEQPVAELRRVQIRKGDHYFDWTPQSMTEVEIIQVFPTHVLAKPKQQPRQSKSKSSSKQTLSSGLRMVPLGRLAADEKMMRTNSTRLFGDFGFCLTLSDQLEPNEEQVTLEAQWLHKPFVWDEIAKAGGKIYRDLSECFHDDRKRKDGIPQTLILISTRPSKTRKYLMALGLGVPIVSSMWVKASLEQGSLVDTNLYRLPNGTSFLTANQSVAPAHPEGVFHGLHIFVSESDAQKRQDWVDILTAGGASVSQKWTATSATVVCDYVVCFTQPSTDSIRQIVSRTDAPIVTSQWVVQCLVHQSILNYRLFDAFSSWS